MFRKLLDQATAGDNVGVLLRGAKRDEVECGMVLAKPGSTPGTHKIVFQLTSLDSNAAALIVRNFDIIYGYKWTITGMPGATNYLIEVSPNFSQWRSPTNIIGTNAPFSFVDPQAVSFRQRLVQ